MNWTAHGRAMQCRINERTHLAKFVHGLLPTNVKLHRLDDPAAIIVAQVAKTARRLGNAFFVAGWRPIHRRTSMVQNVAKKCGDLQTMPSLKAILLQALRERCLYSNDDAPYQLLRVSSTASAAIRRLVYQQNAIGWEYIFWDGLAANGAPSKINTMCNGLIRLTQNDKLGCGGRLQLLVQVWSQCWLVPFMGHQKSIITWRRFQNEGPGRAS